jgi:hypothetical protein
LSLCEAGVLIVDAAGRQLTRFNVPAQRLVIAHSRQQALARRDSLWRVSRLDLVQRRVSDLGVVELDHFACGPTACRSAAWPRATRCQRPRSTSRGGC